MLLVTTGKKLSGRCVLACLTSLVLTNPSLGWQFRDLDHPEPTTPVASIGQTNLQPTTQPFVAPVVNGNQLAPVQATKLAPVVSAENKPVSEKEPIAPSPQPQAAKLIKPSSVAAEATQQPQLAIPEPVPMAEPVAMPELAEPEVEAEFAETDVTRSEDVASDPMEAFGDATSSTMANSRHDAHPVRFHGIQPGTTRVDEVPQHWGEPIKSIGAGTPSQTLVYQLPAFRQIDVTVTDNVVTGLLVHLLTPMKANAIAEQLNLNQFDPVPVPDELGEVLGQAYPERGLMFAFTEDVTELNVTAILAESISGEMYRMRAQHDMDHQFQRNIADLEEAIRLEPDDAEAHWLLAMQQESAGQPQAGLASAQKAVRLEPTRPLYRLTRARIYAQTNRYKTAVAEVRSVLSELDSSSEVTARAHNLLGDLLALGPQADYQEALQHHLKAIDFATKEVENKRYAVRRMAKHVLVNAHLAVARDIAMGNFQRQQEVVPKWLVRATEMADEFIGDDQGDAILKLQILRETLGAYSEIQDNSFDATSVSEESLRMGRDLIANATDTLFKVQVERVLAESLLHASKIQRSRGRYDNAIKYATNAMALIDNSKAHWEATSHDEYMEAELYFVLGSISAIKDGNHEEAVEWYSKAREIFDRSNFISSLYAERSLGEMQVSMGLSYWETEDRNSAIKITQAGSDLMKSAVEKGALRVAAMAIPYGNLATMHAKMGQSDRSEQYAVLVSKVEKLTTESQKRR